MKRLYVFIFLSVCTQAASASEPKGGDTVDVFVKDECKGEYYGSFDLAASLKKPSYVPWSPSHATPIVFRDSRTSITYYVESDGRHVAAIDAEGKLLWVRNPFEDAGQCPYRSPRPVIIGLKTTDVSRDLVGSDVWQRIDTNHKHLIVTFDSSQFGLLDGATGSYHPLGNN